MNRRSQLLRVERLREGWRRTLYAALLLSLLIGWHAVMAAVVPVLVYHRFGAVAADSMTVRTEVFEAQLQQLHASGVSVVPLRQLVDTLRSTGPLPSRAVALTIDDGHRSVYTDVLPLIRRYQLPVTLFIYPSAISNASYAMTWEQLAELKASGLVDIQSHTYWHPNFTHEKRKLDPAAYATFVDWQLVRSKTVLESRFGRKVDMLAWPFGLQDADLRERAARAGYVAAFTLERRPVREGDDPLALPRFLITSAVSPNAFAAIVARARDEAESGKSTREAAR
ncbi:polysaccharide deacetylase family protein [Azoarcus sp. KH32C]|uniref:polysaccharide deacetylase family protein n=1 Tax=Azoarcus sp. KH32C TaxID=748247 RepID=UPI0002386B2E|nr:polysaccharide deacetylase family protein [Azoarcus sp. KH32C]BAL23809.1 polysaccharide deacetylase [Azoarcus sp. KH32C]